MKIMTKKVICLLCVALFLLSACSADNYYENYYENENYRIVEANGKMYIEFLKDFSYTPYKNPPGGRSLEEIREKVLSGQLSNANLQFLQQFSSDNLLEIYNLNELCYLKTPDNVSYYALYWKGYEYSFYADITFYQTRRRSSGIVSIILPQNYEKLYSQLYQKELNLDYRLNIFDHVDETIPTIISDVTKENIAERNAYVIRFTTNWGKYKEIRYRIDKPNGYTEVLEMYCEDDYGGPNPFESDTIPYRTFLFGKDNGVCFWGELNTLEERPSVEWLSQFGVIPVE